jgi:hypothetical protein
MCLNRAHGDLRILHDDIHDYMVRSIRGGIDADIGNNFESYNKTFTKRIEAILEILDY